MDDINTNNIIKDKLKVRYSTEQINPRVYLKKTEQVFHIKYKRTPVLLILVEKFIDDTLVNSYSWMEEMDEDQINEFNQIEQQNKPTPKKPQNRKQYLKEYYNKHKEEFKQKRTQDKKLYQQQYQQEHKEELKQKRLIKYQENKEQIKQKALDYYNSHKEEYKEYKKQYYQKHKQNKK